MAMAIAAGALVGCSSNGPTRPTPIPPPPAGSPGDPGGPPSGNPPPVGTVWIDEFDGDAIDTTSWNVEDSTTTRYGGTEQAWRPANVVVRDGQVHLISRRESAGGRQYTSGAINTRGKRTFRVPFRVEVRARIPFGRGIWPAIWIREGQTNTAVIQEIDIMESIGDPFTVWMTNHTWMPQHQQHASCTKTGEDMSAAMHTYAVEVTEDRIRWFIDGIELCSSTVGIPTDTNHLLINTSIGGSWPGPPDGSTPFPQTFSIDYVRISMP